jgi:hypothetical protein
MDACRRAGRHRANRASGHLSLIVICALILAVQFAAAVSAAAGDSGAQPTSAPLVPASSRGAQRQCCTRVTERTARPSSSRAARPSPLKASVATPVILWIGVGAAAGLLLTIEISMGYQARRRRRIAAGVREPSIAASQPILSMRGGSMGARKLRPPALRGHYAVRPQPSEGLANHQPSERAYPRAGAGGGGRRTHKLLRHDAAPLERSRVGDTEESVEQTDGTVPEADQSVHSRPDDEHDADATFDRGVTLYEAGDLHGAEAAWERAAECGHRRASLNLGFLLQRLGDREGAKAAYAKAANWGDPVAARLVESLSGRTSDASGSSQLQASQAPPNPHPED